MAAPSIESLPGVASVGNNPPQAATVPHQSTINPASPGGAKVAKPRARATERFPKRMTFSMLEMSAALERQSGRGSLFAESDIIRLAIHNYLLAHEPLYVKAMRGEK